MLITEDDPETAGESFQACLTSVGEERTLFDGAAGVATPLSADVSADGGDELALAWVRSVATGPSTRSSQTTASIYDVRTGTVVRRGLASEPCGQPAPPVTVPSSSIDTDDCQQYVDELDLSDGMLAMHVTSLALDDANPNVAEIEQVISSDANGTKVQEEVASPNTDQHLYSVQITGDQLFWQDPGGFSTAQLVPPS